MKSVHDRAMFHIILFRPEIPQNTGNVIRLCANTGCRLHLIRPLGFRMDQRELRRAGLDYHEHAEVAVHDDLSAVTATRPDRVFAFTRHGTRGHHEAAFEPDDVLLFGSETSGLPADVLAPIPVERRLRIPMRPGSRSLNLANAAAIAVYEAWRQQGFAGAAA
jgi:tRNA (cytidine/uridine-2'-O-)-methyltransferase